VPEAGARQEQEPMCGIAGVVSCAGPLRPDIRAAIHSMTARLRHRGPDGEGVVANADAALGHTRLAIIDRAGGRQPLANEDESCWVVFNGEIYNHGDLRRVLEAHGHRFRTHSDTEVIVHAYEQWGCGAVERLEGMFAFAVYDGMRRELFLARDRVGKKPLFYGVLGGAMHFASELKAIAESPAWSGDLDLSTVEEYLELGYILAPRTIFRGIFKLEPGHWLKVGDGRIVVRRYWDVSEFDTDGRLSDSLTVDLESLVRDRTCERLESEVPLGAFLSGGIDSGLVVSYMAEAVNGPIETTTVGFDAAAHNELEAAALTAARYKTHHHEEVVNPQLDEVLDTIVDAFDEPFADASAVPTYFVSAMTRRHVTVALSGDGGDELFGGYDFRYVPHALESHARRICRGAVARQAAGWIGTRWPRSARLPRPLRLGNVLENLSVDPATAYFHDLCFLRPRLARTLLGLDPARADDASGFSTVTEAYNRCPSSHALQRAQYADTKIYLANNGLVKVDRMSMVHGLEVRCPLLDRRIVEFAFRIPTPAKLPRLRPKALLRRLSAHRLPPALLSMPKRGFTAPVAEWLAGVYAERFESDVLAPRAFVATVLDQQLVRRWHADHRARRRDHAYGLWAIWMLERWAGVQRERTLRRAAAPHADPVAAASTAWSVS
jgi:asparagine synthase (glutamine-hydrolysing)